VACQIPLEISQRGLQLCFRPHFHWRSSHKVMGPQSHGSPNFGNFETPIWESRDKMPFGCGPRGEVQNILKGEGGGFPQVQAVVSLVSPNCPWLVLAPKMLQLCVGFVQVRVSSWCLSFFLVPSQSSSTPIYPSKVLRTRERAPTLYSSVVFCLDSHLNPSRSWEHVIANVQKIVEEIA
jgi:hypothetical protein